jgi:isopentenyl diphosphate isomerase/L-lactate dehydrogenase-like FMN-dependent dehydrogenase
VERVLEILPGELALTMRHCGIPSIGRVTKAAIVANRTKG